MPPLIISGAISFVANLLIGLFVYFKNPRSRLNAFFALFSLMVSGWSVGSFLENVIPDRSLALTVLRTNYLFAVWLPAFYVHFVYSFSTITPVRRQVLRIAYAVSAALTAVLYTPLFIRDLRVLQSQPYQFLISSPGPIYYVFFAYFGVSTCEVLRTTLREAKLNSGRRRLQFRYLTVANAIAIAAGFEYFFRVFGFLKSPPWDDYILVIYLLVLAYAMARHHLMDIRLAVARSVIFVLLHTLAIGGPFFVAFSGEAWLRSLTGDKWWLIPFGLLAGLSSLVPALYGFLQAHAEARIFRTERRYQIAVRTMSQELVGFADVKSLCGFVGRYVGEQMGLTSAELIVQGNGLGAPHAVDNNIPPGVKEVLQRWIASPSRTDSYILAEELGAGRPDTEIRAIRTWMTRTGIAAIVPGWMRGELVSCLVLGHKRTGAIFSPEDFEVLEALARQSSLVVKNIELGDEVHAQKRLAEFGELMAAINHEFNNVFAIIGGTLQQLIENPNDPSLKQHLAGLQGEILRGQYIIRAASAYRKKHRTSPEPWSLAEIIGITLTQAQQDGFAGGKPQFTITTAIPKDVEVVGRATIPELISNCLRCLGWACDSKSGTLHIEVSIDAPMAQLRFAMTGGEDLAPIIKKEGELAPEPGRHGGLYLFLVRLIVADHQGSLAIESTKGGGTTIVVRLPQEQVAVAHVPAVHGDQSV